MSGACRLTCVRGPQLRADCDARLMRAAETMGKDYYEVLGVPKNADEAALKKAYRKQALQCVACADR